MSSSETETVLPKDALRQLAKLGMDPAVKKDPLNDASIVKWSTVVAPIATKALMENSANMKVEGKSEAEFRARTFGSRKSAKRDTGCTARRLYSCIHHRRIRCSFVAAGTAL